jgi:hypothetical protein
MAVTFKGGTSGNRGMDFSPPVPGAGSPQPIQFTETSGPVPSSIHLQAETFRPNMPQTATRDFMPTGGTEASGSDLEDQTATSIGPTSGDESVFKGSPNDGLKGGPAVPGV